MIGALALLAAVTSAGYAAGAHDRVDAVTHVQAPSVKATGDFLLQVEDMDAQVANALLISDDTTLRTTRAQSMAIYETDRSDADADLQAATTALAGNPAALNGLNQVVDMFGTYQHLVSRAVQLDEQSHTSKAGTAPAAVVEAYRQALVYLEGGSGNGAGAETLIAHARALYEASNADIKNSAQGAMDELSDAQATVYVSCFLLLIALGVVQWRMSLKFHRRVSPGIAAAGLVTAVLMFAGAAGFSTASDDFHNGKANAFDSVQSLTKAKAVSYDANADESRWLLDPAHAAQYEAAFVTKASQVANIAQPDGARTVADYEADIARADAALTEDATQSDHDLGQTNPLSTGSLLGFELGNITFPDEKHRALIAVDDFSTYLQGDGKIRKFDITTPAGLHDAVDFDTNAETPGTSDQTFNIYSRHLDDVIAVNQTAFGDSMASALSGLGTWSWLPYVFLLLIVGLTLLGLRPRMAEYR